MDTIIKLLAKIFGEFGSLMIIIIAVLNFLVFIYLKWLIKSTENLFKPRSDKRFNVEADMNWNNKQVSELQKKRGRIVSIYALYANVTAIFPLLGILGTVAALVTYSNDTMMDSFMVALSTTLFGVFFAIVFKFLDSFVSGKLDIFVDDADHIIQNIDLNVRKSDEA